MKSSMIWNFKFVLFVSLLILVGLATLVTILNVIYIIVTELIMTPSRNYKRKYKKLYKRRKSGKLHPAKDSNEIPWYWYHTK